MPGLIYFRYNIIKPLVGELFMNMQTNCHRIFRIQIFVSNHFSCSFSQFVFFSEEWNDYVSEETLQISESCDGLVLYLLDVHHCAAQTKYPWKYWSRTGNHLCIWAIISAVSSPIVLAASFCVILRHCSMVISDHVPLQNILSCNEWWASSLPMLLKTITRDLANLKGTDDKTWCNCCALQLLKKGNHILRCLQMKLPVTSLFSLNEQPNYWDKVHNHHLQLPLLDSSCLFAILVIFAWSSRSFSLFRT